MTTVCLNSQLMLICSHVTKYRTYDFLTFLPIYLCLFADLYHLRSDWDQEENSD